MMPALGPSQESTHAGPMGQIPVRYKQEATMYLFPGPKNYPCDILSLVWVSDILRNSSVTPSDGAA